MKNSTKSNKFTWSYKDDPCWIPILHVFCKIQSLKVQSGGERYYENDLKKADKISFLFNQI